MTYIMDDIIDEAKAKLQSRERANHEHNDCIRIAYEWLDAQKKLTNRNARCNFPLKHLIESWAKRYVSQSDVEVAALMHKDIVGSYPTYNISTRLVWPNRSRLARIGEAGKHPDYSRYDNDKSYKSIEP